MSSILALLYVKLINPNKYIYFPLTSFIFLITVDAGHPSLELGLIGNDGMLGIWVVQGVNNSPLQSVVQGSGTALRIPVEIFRRELLANTDLMNSP
jgi:hypothetical protein